MSKELYILVGAALGLILTAIFLPPNYFGVSFPFPDGFVPDSDWARRTFASGDRAGANTAVYGFYAKAAVVTVIGGVVGYFVGQRSGKGS